MFRLFGPKDRRQLRLINIYRNQPGSYFTHKELAEKLDCSKGTVVSDLNDIQELFPDEIKIIQSGTGVTFEFKRKLPENFYFRRYSQNSLDFRLLIDLYNHGEQSIEEMCDRLFISRSSVYRAASQINDFFSETDLNLKMITAPVEVIGDEIDVRLAAPFLISHYYPELEWPFKLINRNEAIELFDILASNSPYLKLFTSNPLVYAQIAVNFEQYAKGYKLSSEE